MAQYPYFLKTRRGRFFRATQPEALEIVWTGAREVVADLLDLIISRHLDAVAESQYYPDFADTFELFNYQENLAQSVADMVISEYQRNRNFLINELGYTLGKATEPPLFNSFSIDLVARV